MFCGGQEKNGSPASNSLMLCAEAHVSTASSSCVGLYPVHWMLKAAPVVVFSEMIGPLFRRGTIRVAGGMLPPGGTVIRQPAMPSPTLLNLKTSGTGITCSNAPLNTVLKPLCEVGSGTTCSWTVSVKST